MRPSNDRPIVRFHSAEIWLKVIVHLAGVAALFATFLR
jgi:hypothetical protein